MKPRMRVYTRWGLGMAAAAILIVLAIEASGRSAPEPPPDPEATPAAVPTKIVTARPDLPAPSTGPGVDETGAVLVARPGREPGVIDVEERVFLPEGVDAVRLRVMAADPKVPESGTPTVSALQASSAEGLVPVTTPRFTAADGEVEINVPGRSLTLRYALTGAVGRSPQSLPGRALVSLKALSAGELGNAKVVTYFYGTVTNIQCTEAPENAQNCGLSQSGRWASLPQAATSSRVIVQFQQTLTP